MAPRTQVITKKIGEGFLTEQFIDITLKVDPDDCSIEYVGSTLHGDTSYTAGGLGVRWEAEAYPNESVVPCAGGGCKKVLNVDVVLWQIRTFFTEKRIREGTVTFPIETTCSEACCPPSDRPDDGGGPVPGDVPHTPGNGEPPPVEQPPPGGVPPGHPGGGGCCCCCCCGGGGGIEEAL